MKRIKLKIKKGDSVKVLAGADKGKTGVVLEVLPRTMRIRVQGVRMQTHFDKQDGLQKKEGLMDYSNVQLVEKASTEKKVTTKKKVSRKSS